MADSSTNYCSGDDYTLEFLGYRFSFGAQDFEERVGAAAVKLGASDQIIDDRGESRDASQLETLLAGVDEPTYNNVFAVGLKEIQELGSLDDTAAADYLYRLTSGLDRVSLIDVIREVETARANYAGTRA